jgi:hypothetical protein
MWLSSRRVRQATPARTAKPRAVARAGVVVRDGFVTKRAHAARQAAASRRSATTRPRANFRTLGSAVSYPRRRRGRVERLGGHPRGAALLLRCGRDVSCAATPYLETGSSRMAVLV